MTKQEQSSARADALSTDRMGDLGKLAEGDPEAARKTLGVLFRLLEAQRTSEPEGGGDGSTHLGALGWLLLVLGAAAALKIGYG